MFRRKTDLVYSTLQQVQRRMTNQTESGQSQSASRSNSRSGMSAGPTKIGTAAYKKKASRPATLSPFTTPQVRKGEDPALTPIEPEQDNAPDTGAGVSPILNQGLPPEPLAQAAPSYGQGILLTFPMLCIMLLLWVISIAVAYNLGPGGNVVQTDPGIGRAEGTAGIGPTERSDSGSIRTVVPSGDRDILVLKSVPNSSNQAIEEFKAQANKLNDVAAKYPDMLKPYFGVRKPRSGGLQLFFGIIDGQIGVKKEDYEKLEGIMSKAKTSDGKGFPGARWISLN